MKLIYLMILTIFILKVEAQTAQFSINGNEYNITHTSKDTVIETHAAPSFIEMIFRMPSIQKKNLYDVVSINFYGNTAGIYKIGCCAPGMYHQSYRNEIIATYWEDNRKQTRLAITENTVGNITITEVKGRKVSGNYYYNTQGSVIKGSFKDIEVSGL